MKRVWPSYMGPRRPYFSPDPQPSVGLCLHRSVWKYQYWCHMRNASPCLYRGAKLCHRNSARRFLASSARTPRQKCAWWSLQGPSAPGPPVQSSPVQGPSAPVPQGARLQGFPCNCALRLLGARATVLAGQDRQETGPGWSRNIQDGQET